MYQSLSQIMFPEVKSALPLSKSEADSFNFVNEAYKHCKTITATDAGIELLRASDLGAEKVAGKTAKADQLSDELA